MSEPTTTGGGSAQNEAARPRPEGAGETAGAVPGSTLASANGPFIRTEFLAVDMLLQHLVDSTLDVDSVRVTFQLVHAGDVVLGPFTKEYLRRG